MKKLPVFLLLLAICFTFLTACGSSADGSSSSSASSSDSSAEAEEELEPAVDTIEYGQLTVATSAVFPPYEDTCDGTGVDGTGLAGIDIQLAKEVAKALGLKLVIQDMEYEDVYDAVQSGTCDIAFSALTYSEDRDAVVDYTNSYTQSILVLLVPAESEITSSEDITATTQIGTVENTTGYFYACDDYGYTHVTAYATASAAIQALQNGDVACLVMDQQPATDLSAADDSLTILDDIYYAESYCAIVAEGNEALQSAVNDALTSLEKDGTIQTIIETYITAD